MCGLAGFVGYENNTELAELANQIQHHRGPDNQSNWNDKYLALAHQRLAIIDLNESANQPFHKYNYVVIYNGELYNYKELRRNLIEKYNIKFATSCDTEVLLEMFHLYGKDCLNHFIGMFAFAIYNKYNNDLFIARDHFGIKPIFYTSTKSTFAFSSELKTLIGVPGLDKTINKKSLVSCLNYQWISGNETMFNSCFKLAPGHYAIHTKSEGLQIHKYWQLTANNHPRKDETETKNEVFNAIEASVKRHMVSDVPVSCFLSGGLDSSIITLLARSHNPSLSTYTIATLKKDKGIEQMPDDERYSNLLANKFKLNHHTIRISPDIVKDLPAIVRTLDEPIGDPAAISTYLICRAAKDAGSKVLLSGMGADEIFFGYRRQKAALMVNSYNKLPKLLKRSVAKIIELLPVKIFGKGFKMARWAKRFISMSNLPIDEAYMRSYSYYDTQELNALFKENISSAVNDLKREHNNLFKRQDNYDVINKICYTDINLFMLGLNLTYTDRASMAASVEVRVPFIDLMVITQAMQIPGALKLKFGITKYILKKAAEKILPKKIIYRKKAAFGAPIRSWISNDLKHLVDDLLSEQSIRNRGIFNYQFINNLIEMDRKGVKDYAYQIYQLITLELWFREFVDQN